MSMDAPPEIIEIIDDGNDPFGDRSATTTYDDSGGPRWAGPIAAAVLIALIGYGVATTASSSGVARVAPVINTTVIPTTTQPVTTTTQPPPIVPYYAADPPREFTVQFAEFTDPERNFFGGSKYQLWATDGSTATSGSWFSIESSLADPSPQIANNAHRVQSGQRSIAISKSGNGESIAVFSVNTHTPVTLTSFGLSDDDLVRVADSVATQGDGVKIDDASVVAGYRMISTVQPWLAVQGNPAEQVYYSSNDISRGGFSVSVAPLPGPGAGASTEDRQLALRFLLDHSTPFDVDGHPAVAGAVPDSQALATWIAGDHIVTVTGATTVPEIIRFARGVHQVSVEEWNGMRFQASRVADRHVFGNFDQGTPLPIAAGTDSAGEPWAISASLQTFSDQQQVFWQFDTNGTSFLSPGDAATINTAVDDRRTFVFAELPRTVAPTARLQITPDGLDPVLVPFTDLGPTVDRTLAAYAFSEPTPYTAQIIGDDGTVLAAWPSS